MAANVKNSDTEIFYGQWPGHSIGGKHLHHILQG